MAAISTKYHTGPADLLPFVFNTLWPNDVIWWHGSRSTFSQVMACCLTASSHYLNQCCLLISEGLWHSPDDTENAQYRYPWYDLARSQWVKSLPCNWGSGTSRFLSSGRIQWTEETGKNILVQRQIPGVGITNTTWQWRHNGRDCVSKHQRLGCLLDR